MHLLLNLTAMRPLMRPHPSLRVPRDLGRNSRKVLRGKMAGTKRDSSNRIIRSPLFTHIPMRSLKSNTKLTMTLRR